MNKDKEIIGYLAPYNMFTSFIKKGDLYIKELPHDGYYPKSIPKCFNNEIGKITLYLPSEIVETWQPFYKEEKTSDIGTKYHIEKEEELSRKIIGYKLLKDLPSIKANTIGKWSNFAIVFHLNDSDKFFDFTKTFIENNTDWFEPIYEKSQKELIEEIYYIGDIESIINFTKILLEKYEIEEKE